MLKQVFILLGHDTAGLHIDGENFATQKFICEQDEPFSNEQMEEIIKKDGNSHDYYEITSVTKWISPFEKQQ